MFYALNLFDLKDEAVYRQYLKTAGPIVQELGGDLVVMGRRTPDVPVHFPGTAIRRRPALVHHRNLQDRGRRS